MLLKISKCLAAVISISCASMILSACVPGADFGGPPPSIALSQIKDAAPHPDTPPLYCKIGRGSALFGREWYDFSDTSFTLYQGDHASVKVSRIHNAQAMTIQAFFDSRGQKLTFCPMLVAPAAQRVSCASLYALEDDFKDGIKRTFDIPTAVRGGGITCAREEKNLRDLDTPQAGGN